MPAGKIAGDVVASPTPLALPIRLGAVAGLAAAAVALGVTLLLGGESTALAGILAALPLVLLVFWLASLRAYRAPALGRLGNAGAWAAALGVALIAVFNLLRAASLTAPGGPLARLLLSSPVVIAATLMVMLLMWGILVRLFRISSCNGSVIFFAIVFTSFASRS